MKKEILTKKRKVVYISHPIKGDERENLKKIREIGRQMNMEEPNTVPFAPYYFDLHVLNDNVDEEREKGLNNNLHLISKGFIDEMRLYGDCISEGMRLEIKAAVSAGIPILSKSEGTRNWTVIAK